MKEGFSELHATPRFVDKKPAQTDVYEKGLEVYRARREFLIANRPYQESATAVLSSDIPVTVVGIGDVHMGSAYSDFDVFNRDTDLIEKTPGMYAVFLSNLVDVPLPSQYPDSMLVNPLTPHEQAEVMNDKLRQLDAKGKLLGMVRSPCHEGWTERRAGIDIQKLIFMGTSIPMMKNGGIVDLRFVDQEEDKQDVATQTYGLGLYHQFGRGYGSGQNKNYANWYQLREVILGGKVEGKPGEDRKSTRLNSSH